MNFKAIRAVFRFLQPYPFALPTLVILGIASSFAEGIGIGLLIPLLDVLLHGSEPSWARSLLDPVLTDLGMFSDQGRLLVIGVGIVGLLLVKAVLVFATVSLAAWVNGRINDDMRRSLYRQMLTVDYSFLIRNEQGRLVSAFETQVWRVMDAMIELYELLITFCTVGVFTVLLFLISWRLTLGVMLLVPVGAILIGRPLIGRVHRLGESAVAAAAALSQQVLHSLNGMRVVRAFGREAHEQAHFDAISGRARTTMFNMERTERIIPSLLEVVYAPIFLGAVVIAGYTSIGVPVLLAFLLLFYRLQPHIKSVDQRRARLAGFGGAIIEISDLLDPADKPPSRTGTQPFHGLQQAITFRDVGFDYRAGPDSRTALHGVSFELPVRKVTAIVGMSGAGKTTIINLLYRFYEPTEGNIRIDGHPLAELDVVSWRARLALAGQDAALLDGSIFDNIAYGRPDADRDSVVEAAKLAAAHDFIDALPRGYETDVGDRGIRLSEGQRQRIGLARALLRQPDILILDEATNALDGLNEQVVQQALDRLARKITIIVIAHRLSTIRKADTVILLNEGRLVEQGTTGDLLARGGAFALLYAAQHEDWDDRVARIGAGQ